MHLGAGDSLLHGRHFARHELGGAAEGFRRVLRHHDAAEDSAELDAILGRQYHAVVGNPPYIAPKDAATVEAVDLRDLVDFARRLDFGRQDALQQVVEFASSVMTNVGAASFLGRIAVLERGSQRTAASDAEAAGLHFKANPSPQTAVELLVEIGKQSGVRAHRPTVLRACIKALQSCDGRVENSFLSSVVRAREQNRLVGRPLPRRAVGSTLLLKGLEADVAVILDAGDLNAKNLYVAMTRAARRLVICSQKLVLCG